MVATVEYAHVARPGPAGPFSVTVASRNGPLLPPSLEVAVALDYMEMFDEHGLDPQPASEHTDDGDLVWSFDVPRGSGRFLWLVVRGTGKRSLSQLPPLDILLVVAIGDIVQQGVTQDDMSVTGAVLPVAVFVLWMLVGDRIARRSSSGERVLHGSPISRRANPCSTRCTASG